MAVLVNTAGLEVVVWCGLLYSPVSDPIFANDSNGFSFACQCGELEFPGSGRIVAVAMSGFRTLNLDAAVEIRFTTAEDSLFGEEVEGSGELASSPSSSSVNCPTFARGSSCTHERLLP